MTKCKRCGKTIYSGYFCDKCKKEKAGLKPRKSKDLCAGCHDTFYANKYRDSGGCWSYKSSKVVLNEHVYRHSRQVVPDVEWKLDCWHR